MTGNAPDLPLYARICREYDALLYVDDAHGFGSSASRRRPDMPYGYRGNSIVRFFDESYENLVLVAGFLQVLFLAGRLPGSPHLA